MTQFDIRITSDPVCPWCYIGQKRLQRAITLFQKTVPGGSKDEFRISWEPFYLDQIPRPHSVPKKVRMKERMGSDEGVQKGITLLRKVGAPEGINFNFDGYIGSSRLAHRVIKFAGTKGSEVQNRVMEAIFQGHFEETKDITLADDLVELAVRGGLQEGEVRDLLRSEGDEGIDREAQKAREEGIKGVPRFVINGEVLDGAQEADEFFNLFLEVREQQA